MVLKVRHWESRDPYVLLGSDTDFLCDQEQFFFFFPNFLFVLSI